MTLDNVDNDLDALKETPNVLTKLVEDLTEEAIRFRFSDDEFSVLETVCHLRDIEREGYALRIERILDEEHPLLADLDGARLALERNYNQEDLKRALQSFSDARAKNVNTCDHLRSEQFDRTGELQGVGTVSLRRLLAMLHDHDESHLDEVRVLKRKLAARPQDQPYRSTA